MLEGEVMSMGGPATPSGGKTEGAFCSGRLWKRAEKLPEGSRGAGGPEIAFPERTIRTVENDG